MTFQHKVHIAHHNKPTRLNCRQDAQLNASSHQTAQAGDVDALSQPKHRHCKPCQRRCWHNHNTAAWKKARKGSPLCTNKHSTSAAVLVCTSRSACETAEHNKQGIEPLILLAQQRVAGRASDSALPDTSDEPTKYNLFNLNHDMLMPPPPLEPTTGAAMYGRRSAPRLTPVSPVLSYGQC
jgi:hypothetical protein